MGFKVGRNVPPMQRELIYLLADLCVKWGFCIPPDDHRGQFILSFYRDATRFSLTKADTQEWVPWAVGSYVWGVSFFLDEKGAKNQAGPKSGPHASPAPYGPAMPTLNKHLSSV